MKIYRNRIGLYKFRWFYPLGKNFFLKYLVGINISTEGEGVYVEPIYLPVLRYELIGRSLLLEFSLGKPLLLVVITDQYPFVVISRSDAVRLEEEQ